MQERRDWQELRSCEAIVASLIEDGEYRGDLGSNEMDLILCGLAI
jgi:hypothetical protein